jgi:hypothetical protein
MELQPGACYKIQARQIPALRQFGNFEFVVIIVHANDTSDSIVLEFNRIIGASSIEQEIAVKTLVESHADGIEIQDNTGAMLNMRPFEKESEFKQWIDAGIAIPCSCYS